MTPNIDREIIPLLEEELSIGKHTVAKSQVKINFETHERVETVAGDLAVETVEIERTPIGAFVEGVPPVRQEGNVTVYPILEEVLVKRLRLVEEVRVTQARIASPFEKTVTLRRQEAVVERSKSK